VVESMRHIAVQEMNRKVCFASVCLNHYKWISLFLWLISRI
jgi:hypothetical protein